jgi:hypothetical protein
MLWAVSDNGVNQAVLLGFGSGQPLVALHIFVDLGRFLAGVFGHDFLKQLFDAQDSRRSISWSVTLPRVPRDGWWIMAVALGSMKRLPLVPLLSSNAAAEA